MADHEYFDDVVISGMSGKCANADNFGEMKYQLYNKIDMISKPHRFECTADGPQRYGSIPHADKFDHAFFSAMPGNNIDIMDPFNRMGLEVICEALWDAGISLEEIRGSRTSIYTGSSYSESEAKCRMIEKPNQNQFIGMTRTLMLESIGHFLGINGPKCMADSGCSSSLHSLELAVRDLQMGKTDYAILSGQNLTVSNGVSVQFYNFGVLSHEAVCRTFDADALGYVRSDGLITLILQRAKNAKRQYAKIACVVNSCEGFKERGITHPSEEEQCDMFEEIYNNSTISMNQIGFIETHGTGTKVGDSIELRSIEKSFCANRTDPLYVGSMKSNLGHCEAASGIISMVKGCWIIDSNKIPPNINYKTPHPRVPGLRNGKLKVITEVIDLPHDKPHMAINNFGFGGAIGHTILSKPHRRIKTEVDTSSPILVCLSSRTQEGLLTLYNDLKGRPFDRDFISLLNASFGGQTNMLDFRGFCVADRNGYTELTIKEHKDDAKPLLCFFDSFGVSGLGQSLITFKRFQQHIKNVEDILVLHKIKSGLPIQFTKSKENGCDNQLLTVILQTGIVELFKELRLNISIFAGSGIGVLSAAYADSILNLDQTILITCHLSGIVINGKNGRNELMCTQLEEICKLIPQPIKWNIQEIISSPENFPQYLANLPKNNIPKITNEQLLIIGGNDFPREDSISINDSGSNTEFLHAVGKLHLLSYYKDVNKLFDVEWPVKANTPMISPLVKWNYTKTFKDTSHNITSNIKQFQISLSDPNWQLVIGHNIDGRVLFPGSGHMKLVMMTFGENKYHPIRFSNFTFHRACTISEEHDLTLTVEIQNATGEFTVSEGTSVLVSGVVKLVHNFDQEWISLPPLPKPNEEDLRTSKDIYKELRLRGYYYSHDYKVMQNCNMDCTVGNIKWIDWISFLDAMVQLKEFSQESRNLSIVTRIQEILIHPQKHLELVYANNPNGDSVIPVYHYKELGVMRSGFVEVRGVDISCIPRRKNPEPLYETYSFVPYTGFLEMENVAHVLLQIALENSFTTNVKVSEEFNNVPKSMEPLLPYIQKSIHNIPLVQPELYLYSTDECYLDNILPLSKKIAPDASNLLAVGYKLSSNSTLLSTLKAAIKPNGFLISREVIDSNPTFPNLTIICEYTTNSEKIVMLQVSKIIPESKLINITANEFEWVDQVKTAKINKENVILHSDNSRGSGIMGLTKCLLKEFEPSQVVTVITDDKKAPAFDSNAKFYQKQLSKNLRTNIYRNGEWGSYWYQVINAKQHVKTEHSFVTNTVRGDLSSLSWMQGNVYDYVKKDGWENVCIYNSGLNFKDVMLASGKMSDNFNGFIKHHHLGMEFSGRRKNGDRVMGIVNHGAISTMIQVSEDSLWTIPDEWTMEEAATVPCVYLTSIYGIIMRAQLQEGDSILIHSATGGIGLSAINIALHYRCNIFLTVGNSTKKKYILRQYPMIPESHIGNSRDTSFYEMILRKTNGRGVSIILNSLADEKLQSSVHCLGIGGRFIEIGKVDCSNNSLLGADLANKHAEYHGVMLDEVLDCLGLKLKTICQLLGEGIKLGYVKPITYTKFNKDELENAFRYMSNGEHIGKIVVNIQREEDEKLTCPKLSPNVVEPRIYCNPLGTYIILGGLGGFGLELVNFLVVRGARNVVIVSRRGITSGYQRHRIQLWESHDCKIHITTLDCTTKEGCRQMLKEAQQMGDILGVFNLAVHLSDGLIETQTKESFLNTYKPKGQCTLFLDELTRILCPKLEYFVMFSSIISGRGKAVLTTYAYANAAMENICEKRVADGLPGIAIQWGVVGDVGIAIDYLDQNIGVNVGGTMPQPIASCLESLDMLLARKEPVVSSFVMSEKQTDSGGEDSIIGVICGILSIKNIKTISPNSKFPEIGMDSMMAVEVQQSLERDFGIVLLPHEVRNMTFATLSELSKASGN